MGGSSLPFAGSHYNVRISEHSVLKNRRSMHIPSFAQINAFIAVAEHKSFAKAAGALNIAPSTLSPIISGLERDLVAQLFNRTTRSVSITELGEDLLKRIQPAIRDYLQAIQSVNELTNKPIGKVRL